MDVSTDNDNHNDDEGADDGEENKVIEIVLALDIGSSSIRCSAFQVINKRQVQLYKDCFAVRHISTVEPNTGKIMLTTAESGTDLLEEIDGIVDACLLKLRHHSSTTSTIRVVGLGFASFCMNLVALNEYGKPIGKEATLSYACATSSVAEECRYLKNHLGMDREKELYQRTGTPIHSSYALAQLRELYSNPESAHIVDQIFIWQTLSSTCLTRWRGTPFSHVSYSEASWTGLFNFRTCEWDKEAVSLLPQACQNHMPPLADYHDDVSMPSGGMRPEFSITEDAGERNPYWDRWPELRGPIASAAAGDSNNTATSGCRLLFGLGDGACATIGSKCCSSQKISVTIGTSAAVRVCLPMRASSNSTSATGADAVPEGLFLYRLDRSHIVVGGALTDGGSIIAWARELLALQNDKDFYACLQDVEQLLNQEYQQCTSSQDETDTTAVSLVPFLSGERSTGFRDGASFCMTGLTRTSTRVHFVKACLEGVILRLEAILRLLRSVVVVSTNSKRQQPRIVVSGTALERNALWRQMLADCSGLLVQLDTSTATQTTSVGVATMVAMALQMEQDMATDSTTYLEQLQSTSRGESIYSSPRLPITESYWVVALEDQENLIDAVSSLW